MNKRQFKKLKNKQFFDVVSKVNKDEVIIMEFDMDKITVQSLSRFADIFKSHIDGKFILMPKNKIQFVKALGKDKTIEYLKNIIADLEK